MLSEGVYNREYDQYGRERMEKGLICPSLWPLNARSIVSLITLSIYRS